MELIFATHNLNKLEEVKQMLPQGFVFKTLNEIDFQEEIEETEDSFQGNAALKARTIYTKIQKPVFADDSGLVIEALGGAPGIFSARYAGTGNSKDNIDKVLEELKEIENRNAYFICIFCLIMEGKEYFFEGKIYGEIAHEVRGTEGFGYDPIFIPEKKQLSFAQISPQEKNSISHRAIAVEKLSTFLSKL